MRGSSSSCVLFKSFIYFSGFPRLFFLLSREERLGSSSFLEGGLQIFPGDALSRDSRVMMVLPSCPPLDRGPPFASPLLFGLEGRYLPMLELDSFLT